MARTPLERLITELTHHFARQVVAALRNASLDEIVANRALGALRDASLEEIIAMTAPRAEPKRANNKGTSIVDGWTKRYKLSPAQAWILQAVVDGKTRDEIAAERVPRWSRRRVTSTSCSRRPAMTPCSLRFLSRARVSGSRVRRDSDERWVAGTNDDGRGREIAVKTMYVQRERNFVYYLGLMEFRSGRRLSAKGAGFQISGVSSRTRRFAHRSVTFCSWQWAVASRTMSARRRCPTKSM